MSLRAVGTGLSFDGVDDYVDIPDSISVGKSITVLAWVKSAEATWNTYGWIASSRVANGFMIHPWSGEKRVGMYVFDDAGNGHKIDDVLPSDITVWHLYGLVYDDANGLAYIVLDNNITQYSLSITRAPDTIPADIGRDYDFTDRYGHGAIDSVRIYNRALSAEEVQALYRNEAVSNEGLVLYLPLNAGSGDTAKDFSGQGNNGTINGARWYGFRPVRSGGLIFDGIDDNVNCGNDESLRPTSAITLTTWIYYKGGGGTNPRIIGGRNKYFLIIEGDTGKGWFSIWDEATRYDCETDTIGALPLNKWIHLVGSYDGNELRIYVNGELDTSTTHTGDIDTDSNNIIIGDSPPASGTDVFDGSIALLRIYNRALSDQEIADLYLGKEISREGLVLDMPMNEGQGSVAHDYSGEGNNGTIEGASWYGNMPVKRTISAKRAIAVKR